MIERNESEEMFGALWECSPDALVMVDPKGLIVMVNSRAEVLFGYETGELLGRPLEILLPERYRGAHVGYRAGYFAKPSPRPMISALELFALRKDGSEFAVEISLSTVKQAEEVFALSAIRDVTESQRTTKQLASALERIRALHEIEAAAASSLDGEQVLELLLDKIAAFFPSNPVGIRLIDPQSGEYNHVAARNIEIEGLTQALAKSGRALSDLVMESGAPVVIEDILQHPIPGLTDFLFEQGLISYLGLPLVARDKTVGVLSIFTKGERRFSDYDIDFFSTLSTQAAMAIHNSRLHKDLANHALSLQSANEAKEEFLGFVSHELKTPLNLLNGYTGLMRDKAFGEINEEQAAALKKMEGFCQELLRMIDSLLQAGRIDGGAAAVAKDEIHLSDFLGELETMYALPRKTELALHWKYSSALPVIKTDRVKLKHILQNLINNAIKYTEKGSVTISARIIEGEARPSTVDSEPSTERTHKASGSQAETRNSPLQAGSQKWVEFKVADTGVGIPRESLIVIFKRFHQLGGTRTKSSGGVGLGLHIVKMFTELLGGEIDVESEPGKGSIFTVVVPAEI
jgi:protein-histidine pros-kinase